MQALGFQSPTDKKVANWRVLFLMQPSKKLGNCFIKEGSCKTYKPINIRFRGRDADGDPNGAPGLARKGDKIIVIAVIPSVKIISQLVR